MTEHRMRKFWLMAFAVVMSFAITAPFARAADKDKGDSPLEDEMIAANKALKTLKTQITDASKNASSLQLIGEMQKHFVAAKDMEPLRSKKVPEGERAKFLADYRKAMINLLSEMLKLESAVLDNKNDDASAILKNLTKIKSDGHDKFQEE
jgi:soluble cytochrome b562